MDDEPKTPRQKRERASSVFRLVVAATAAGMTVCLAVGTALFVWAEYVGPGPAGH